MKIMENEWKWMKLMKINKDEWKLLKIIENYWKLLKIIENEFRVYWAGLTLTNIFKEDLYHPAQTTVTQN